MSPSNISGQPSSFLTTNGKLTLIVMFMQGICVTINNYLLGPSLVTGTATDLHVSPSDIPGQPSLENEVASSSLTTCTNGRPT